MSKLLGKKGVGSNKNVGKLLSFKEDLHPRNNDGRFKYKGLLGGSKVDYVMKQAKQSGPEVDGLGKSISDKYGGTLTPINYKSKDSIVRKVDSDLGGDYGELKDSVRNTVVVPYKDLDRVVRDLKTDKGTFIRVKVQDGPEYFGYKGVITNIKTKNGIVAEMQVNSPGMIYAKSDKASALNVMSESQYNQIAKETGLPGGMGHIYYEKIRVLDAKVKRLNATDEEMSEYGALVENSIRYYSKFYGY